MRRVVAIRGRQCQDCGRSNCRLFGDHIVELQDGGDPLDEANVLLRCGSCHTRKTSAARAERASPHY
jgi:5-methylcytosine-specific restriction protein A